MQKKKILFFPADKSACGLYRVIEPVSRLKQLDLPDLEFHYYFDEMPNEINKLELSAYCRTFDAVVFQRVCHPTILEVLKEVKSAGKKVYMDLDDALFNVSPQNIAYSVWHKGSTAWNVLLEALKITDCLFLSTPELVEIYKPFHNNSIIFRNALDLSKPGYDQSKNRRHQLPQDKVIIGWAGSTSHVDSLSQITKPIKKIMAERNDCIFALCGNREFIDFFDIPKGKAAYIKHTSIEDFPPVMSLFDISLATIKPGTFNSGKSELKCLEAAAWGVPSVCTMEAPYLRFNKNSDKANFLVYENDVNEWVRKINKLVDDAVLRKEMGIKSYNSIKTHYDLNLVNQERIEFFRKELI